MVRFSRLLFVVLSLAIPSLSWAVDWTTPTPEELSMTSQPEVPGAVAVYLYRQETTRDIWQAANDANPESQREGFCSTVEGDSPIINLTPDADPKLNSQTLYVRLKVLTAEGVRYGNVVIEEPEPYWSAAKVEGRTIQPDGTIVPFSGAVDRRLISKSHYMLRYRTAFQMPDVRAGSILEYRVTVIYPEYGEAPPRWFVQRELFVRKADYLYRPHTWVRKPEESNYGFTNTLPQGTAVVYKQADRTYSLHVEKVLPLTNEFPPPLHAMAYNVIFHHTCFPSVQEFWNTQGKWWTGDVEHFISASNLKSVAGELVGPGDTEQQKADKLYAAVASVKNLSFGQGDTAAADERAEFKIRNASEVWKGKQGSSPDLTLLFVGLARAAGLKAYAMTMTDRSQDIFDPKAVREEDLYDYVAIVSIDGKEQYYDPGSPFCPPGQLSWKHSFGSGLRQTDAAPTFAQTPGADYKQSKTQRTAKLQLAKDGSFTGTASVVLTGSPALDWRQAALWNPAAIDDQIAAQLAVSLPGGFSVKTIKVSGLTDPVTSSSSPLSVQLELTGTFAPGPGGEISVPTSLFEARTGPYFTAEKRDIPVDMRYPGVTQDVVALMLPAGLKPKAPLADASIPLTGSAMLSVKHSPADTYYSTTRTLIQGKTFYPVPDYPDLKAFFAKVSTENAEKVVLAPAP